MSRWVLAHTLYKKKVLSKNASSKLSPYPLLAPALDVSPFHFHLFFLLFSGDAFTFACFHVVLFCSDRIVSYRKLSSSNTTTHRGFPVRSNPVTPMQIVRLVSKPALCLVNEEGGELSLSHSSLLWALRLYPATAFSSGLL